MLNYSIETLYDALNNNISLADNINCKVKDITVTVDSTGRPTTPTTYTITGITGNAVGLQVIRAINNTNPNVYPTSGIFISYATANSGANPAVTINNITGLPAGNSFTLRIVTYGG